MTSIGENIKNTRKKLGITQEELAEKLSVTRQAVSNWENGKTEPDIETLTKIAQIFNISIDGLVDGIPKGITELRGKKVYLKLGIIFTAFYVISTLILLIIKNPLYEYVGSTYDTLPYFLTGFIWKPFTVISGGIGISALVAYSTGFYIKSSILRIVLLVLGVVCFILTTVYLIYTVFIYRFELSFLFSPYYYVFLLENPFLHVLAPVMIFFGISEK